MALQGGILYSGSKDCSVRSWDLIAGRQLSCARDHRDYVLSLCVGAELCVSGGAADHLMIIYDTDHTGKLTARHKLSGHSGWVTCLDLTTDATRVVSGSKDHQVKVWDTKTGSLLLSLTQDAEITCLSVYPLIPGQ